jgi:hypothetical protein
MDGPDLESGLESDLWGRLLIIADYLEEEKAEPAQAWAYRWLAQERRLPVRYDQRWHWRRNDDTLPELMHQLPRAALTFMSNLVPETPACDAYESLSMAGAYRRAALALGLAYLAGQLSDPWASPEVRIPETPETPVAPLAPEPRERPLRGLEMVRADPQAAPIRGVDGVTYYHATRMEYDPATGDLVERERILVAEGEPPDEWPTHDFTVNFPVPNADNPDNPDDLPF